MSVRVLVSICEVLVARKPGKIVPAVGIAIQTNVVDIQLCIPNDVQVGGRIKDRL